MTIKDHWVDFFEAKGLIFKYAPSNFQDILLQEAVDRYGTVPYLTLQLGVNKVQFTLDSGCSHNLLTYKSYSFIKQLETHSYTASNVSLRTIDNTISDNVITRVTFIPLTIGNKTFHLKFYVAKKFDRNFLGTSFLLETQASVIFKKDVNSHVLIVNDITFPLDFLYLSEVMANNALLDSPSANSNSTSANSNPTSANSNSSADIKTKTETLIKNNISFTQQAFDLFENETNLNNRVTEILNHFNCIPQEEISASAGNLDYKSLEDFEIYPGPEMQDFLEKKIYLPDFNELENDPFSFESDHLTTEQSDFLKNIINDHKKAISTKTDPVGDFKLFQIALNFFPNKTAHQVKRNLDFDLVNQDIKKWLT